jgi:hypothetical protein
MWVMDESYLENIFGLFLSLVVPCGALFPSASCSVCQAQTSLLCPTVISLGMFLGEIESTGTTGSTGAIGSSGIISISL